MKISEKAALAMAGYTKAEIEAMEQPVPQPAPQPAPHVKVLYPYHPTAESDW